MPLITQTRYRPEPFLRNPHVNTVWSAVGRRIADVRFQRERIATQDDDFLDLDWSLAGSDRLLVILHGLEGSTDRPYVRGMTRCANTYGWDVLAMNFRGCSGEENRQPRTYHMGETGDLQYVVQHALATGRYRRIGLAGYSLGGNVVMMYLGRDHQKVPQEVVGGVAYSVPCDIPSANERINRWDNFLYRYRFMRSLNKKLYTKAQHFPELFSDPLPRSTTFLTFDDYFTAPVHGFRNAMDYWTTCSSLPFLSDIRRPLLLVNAQDDTFLSESCFPRALAGKHPYFFLETPRWGGHVGFFNLRRRHLWSERRGIDFLNEACSAVLRC